MVPVVIFLWTGAGAPRSLRLGGERYVYLDFRYLSCALAELPFDAHRDSDNERFREEGMQQGMQRGTQQGEARVLERQLRLKFGNLPEEVRRCIQQVDEHTLLEWSERVLVASRLDEVLH